MSEVMTISGVRGYLDANGIAHINAEDAARGLGFVQVKNGKEYVRWETINKYLNEFGYDSFSQLVGKDDYIPENIFYRLAMKANNEAAQKFQAKVADEILPSIRRTGFYATKAKIEAIVRNPDLFIEELMTAYKRVKSERDAARAQVESLKPDADYCRSVLQSKEALPITVIAKDYGYAPAAFNELLYKPCEIHYKRGNTWVLFQQYVGKGYTDTVTKLLKNGLAVTHTYWTQKGRQFLYEKLKSHKILPLCEQQAHQLPLF